MSCTSKVTVALFALTAPALAAGTGLAADSDSDPDRVAALNKVVRFFSDKIQQDPTDAKAFSERGAARQALCDFDKAIADYDEAIRLDTNN